MAEPDTSGAAAHLDYGRAVTDVRETVTEPRRRVTHLTGLGEVAAAQRREAAKAAEARFDETLEDRCDRLFGIYLQAFKSWTDTAERRRFDELLRKATVQALVDESKQLVDDVPFGRTLSLAIRLSAAFAEGVGTELERVNARLRAEYDMPVADEIGPAELRQLQAIRQYQARAVAELPGILAEGLAAVVGELCEEAQGWVSDTLAGMLADVCKQLARSFVNDNRTLFLVGQSLRHAIAEVPAARLRAERAALKYASRAWIELYASESIRKDLLKLQKALTSDKDVDLALVAALLEMLVTGGYAHLVRTRDATAAAAELKALLEQQARALIGRLQADDVEVKRGASLEVDIARGEIVIPAVLGDLLRQRGSTELAVMLEEVRLDDRLQVFDRYIAEEVRLLHGVRITLAANVRRSRTTADAANARLERLQAMARQRARVGGAAIAKEFGRTVGIFDVREEVDQRVRLITFESILPPGLKAWGPTAR
jgi:hypothetical protein